MLGNADVVCLNYQHQARRPKEGEGRRGGLHTSVTAYYEEVALTASRSGRDFHEFITSAWPDYASFNAGVIMENVCKYSRNEMKAMKTF